MRSTLLLIKKLMVLLSHDASGFDQTLMIFGYSPVSMFIESGSRHVMSYDFSDGQNIVLYEVMVKLSYDDSICSPLNFIVDMPFSPINLSP